jgi:hypothetical protein
VVSPRSTQLGDYTLLIVFPEDKAQVEAIGLLDSDEQCEEVNLEEDIDTEEFWNQPETLRDLQRLLTTSISSSSFLESEESLPARPVATTSRNIFGRKKSAPVPAVIPKRQQIEVKASQEDMAYRIESEFGLYETLTKPAIVVRVDTRA